MTIFTDSIGRAGVSIGRLLAMIFLMLTVGLASAQESEADSYKISIGDSVRVVVYGHEDLSGECEIDGAGRCSLPLIKFVDAEGLTSSELEDLITDELQPEYLKEPRVSVEIIAYRPIYVLGEVRTPGSYPFTSGMTVVKAIALAGGYTHRAAKRKITVVHAGTGNDDKLPVGEADELAPGDVIEVPERFF